MQLLDETNAADYLRRTGVIPPDEPVVVRELSGGVSNVVLHVAPGQGRGADFVLKQARRQLRVKEPWFCSVERIWREVEVLRVAGDTLTRTTPARRASEGTLNAAAASSQGPRLTVFVPEILFEDRENYCFGMAAAPPGHRTWKQDLLAGKCDVAIAMACGELLGRLHAGTWQDTDLVERLSDRTFFEDLRVAPYYRHVASVHADLRPQIEKLIASLEQHPRCLVHGDFSPKNLLVWNEAGSPTPTHLLLIDCEVGHFGDPAFDLGFILSHLVLKAVHLHGSTADNADTLDLAQEFLAEYFRIVETASPSEEIQGLLRRATNNLAGCLLARVDGKSPVEYLRNESSKQLVRCLARWLFDCESQIIDPSLWTRIREDIGGKA